MGWPFQGRVGWGRFLRRKVWGGQEMTGISTAILRATFSFLSITLGHTRGKLPFQGKMDVFWYSDSQPAVLGSDVDMLLREAFPTLRLNIKKTSPVYAFIKHLNSKYFIYPEFINIWCKELGRESSFFFFFCIIMDTGTLGQFLWKSVEVFLSPEGGTLPLECQPWAFPPLCPFQQPKAANIKVPSSPVPATMAGNILGRAHVPVAGYPHAWCRERSVW